MLADRDYSQHGEQAIIFDYFSLHQTGYSRYCVDAGAYDGAVGSNSRALFLNGWSGLAIEPNPRTFSRLNALYADNQNVTCIQLALSDKVQGGAVMSFSIGPKGVPEEDKWQYAQVSTFDQAFANSYRRDHGYIYEDGLVDVRTLTSVLRDNHAPRDMGFLSVDCEGEDIKIIKELDLSYYRPALICVESDDNNRHVYSQHLTEKYYRYHAHTSGNTFFKSVSSF